MRDNALGLGRWLSGARRVVPHRALICGLVVLSLLVAGCADPTESEEYAQLQSQLSDVESELTATVDAADQAAAEADAELDALRDEILNLESELLDKSAALESTVESSDRFAELVRHLVAFDMWIDAGFLQTLEPYGLDTAFGDQILTEQSWGGSWVNYAEVEGFNVVLATSWPLDQQKLRASWGTYLETPLGSDEEQAALSNYALQLWALTLDMADEVAAE